jgi:hypothetical protein
MPYLSEAPPLGISGANPSLIKPGLPEHMGLENKDIRLLADALFV